MPPELTPEAWAQIRHDYEHTETPIEAICAAHGISSGTLRDRMRRWRWARRRPPIPRDGPPSIAPPASEPSFAMWTATPGLSLSGGGRAEAASPSVPAPPASIWDCDAAAPCATAAAPIELAAPNDLLRPPTAAGGEVAAPAEADEQAIIARLQSAVARVLPAIEATVDKLGAGPMPPREMEQTARALGSLTRTLRELNGLLGQRQEEAAKRPMDVEALRASLARKLEALIAKQDREEDANHGAWQAGGVAQGS